MIAQPIYATITFEDGVHQTEVEAVAYGRFVVHRAYRWNVLTDAPVQGASWQLGFVYTPKDGRDKPQVAGLNIASHSEAWVNALAAALYAVTVAESLDPDDLLPEDDTPGKSRDCAPGDTRDRLRVVARAVMAIADKGVWKQVLT